MFVRQHSADSEYPNPIVWYCQFRSKCTYIYNIYVGKLREKAWEPWRRDSDSKRRFFLININLYKDCIGFLLNQSLHLLYMPRHNSISEVWFPLFACIAKRVYSSFGLFKFNLWFWEFIARILDFSFATKNQFLDLIPLECFIVFEFVQSVKVQSNRVYYCRVSILFSWLRG